MYLPLQALCWGCLSALSLPIGALVGLYCAPVPERVTAYFMAFGSGCVVFAVATQLYGDDLYALAFSRDSKCRYSDSPEAKLSCYEDLRGQFLRLCVQVLAGVVGASVYKMLNQWLQNMAEEPADAEAAPGDTALFVEEGGGRSSSMPDVNFAFDGSHASQGGLLASAPSDRDPPTKQRSILCTLDSSTRASTRGRCADAALDRSDGASLDTVVSQEKGVSAKKSGAGVALSMWLGVALDGIPEALMMGLMTNNGDISVVFVITIFVANFPEAFSAASLLREIGVGRVKIVAMWTSVFVGTGVLAFLGSLAMPGKGTNTTLEKVQPVATAILEGLTGGAMFAMISTAMIPEAFHGAGDAAGILFVLGFLTACLMQVFGVAFGELGDGLPAFVL